MTYPRAPRGDDADVLHGRTVPDPYRRLEDPADPATVDWSRSQDELLDGHRAGWTARKRLHDRLAELLRAGSVGTPAWRGERAFHTRRTADQEHAVLLTLDAGGAERILVDPTAVDPTGATTLDSWQPSREGDLLAYQLSAGGTEESVLRVLDVGTGQDVDGPIDRARYSPVAWLPGGDAFYYVRRLSPELVPAGEGQYHRRVYLHRLGGDPAEDVEIFGAGLPVTTYFGVSVSRDGRWLVVTAAEGTAPRNDLWLADLRGSDPWSPGLMPVQVGVDARLYPEVGRDGRLYLWTDRDAPRGRLAVCDPADPDPANWTDLLPEDPEAVLEDYAILDDLDRPVLVATWTRHAISEVSVHDLVTGERAGTVDLPGLSSVGGLSERPEGGHEAWFGYTDHTTPGRVLRYDAVSESLTTWAESPGAVDVPAVSSRQVTYRSTDGTEVRMVIVSPDGRPDRPRPAVLYGYGGFNVSLTPAFSASILAWVEAGGVWAVAGLRGGAEEGETWHRARDARAQAERLRRLQRRRRVPRGGRVDHRRAARDLGRLQRRPSGGRRPHPAAGTLPCGRLLGAVAGHGPLREVRARCHLERRVRHGRGPRAAGVAAVVLALPPRPRRRQLPGRPVHGLRRRHPRGHDARAEDVRRPAGGHVCGPRASAGAHPGRG